MSDRSVYITKNPDAEYVKKIRKAIKANSGYCVSQFERTPETKCMCKEFIEQEEGMCRCGLYIKRVEED